MANFNIAFEKSKGLEGVNGQNVWAKLKEDNGGETYGGIARVYNPKWKGWAIIDAYKKANGGKIKANTHIDNSELEDLVKLYYRVEFWDKKAKGDLIKNQDVANLVYDMSVNHGKFGEVVNTGIKNAGFKVKVANAINSDTLNYLNSIPEKVYPSILKARENYYKTLDDYDSFGRGWMNRLAKFPQQISSFISSGGGSTMLLLAVFIGLVIFYIYSQNKF